MVLKMVLNFYIKNFMKNYDDNNLNMDEYWIK